MKKVKTELQEQRQSLIKNSGLLQILQGVNLGISVLIFMPNYDCI